MLGYRREYQEWGIRNHVVIFAAMDLVNGIVQHIARLVTPTIPLPIWYGRGQYGRDKALTDRTLQGLANHPNVGGVVVVSLEQNSASDLYDEVRAHGKLAAKVVVQNTGGSLDAIMQGAKCAADMLTTLSRCQREPMDLSDLVLGMECGASDTTSGIIANPTMGAIADRVVDEGGTVIFSETAELVGAESLLVQRAASPEVAERIMTIVNKVEMEARRRGTSLLGTNPSPDNIRGGLSSLEEKSLGAIIKGGTRPIQGVLEFGERPPSRGLFIMDTPAPASESMTGLAAGGCQMIIFSTGQGNPVGFPLVPTIKVSANPDTARRQGADLDVDLSGVALGAMTIEDARALMWQTVDWVASGQWTRAEIFSNVGMALNRIEPTV